MLHKVAWSSNACSTCHHSAYLQERSEPCSGVPPPAMNIMRAKAATCIIGEFGLARSQLRFLQIEAGIGRR